MRFDRRILGIAGVMLAACGAFSGSDVSPSGHPEDGGADGAPATADGSIDLPSGGSDAGSAIDAADAAKPPRPNANCFQNAGGTATVSTNPTSPTSNASFDVSVTDTPAYTNVELTFCTPLTNQPPKNQSVTSVTGTKTHTWTFHDDAGLPAGITQIVFRADPAEKVYGTAEVVVQ